MTSPRLVAALAVACWSAAAFALECPDPLRLPKSDWQGQVLRRVGRVNTVAPADGAALVSRVTHDVTAKWPRENGVQFMVLTAACSSLRYDGTMPEREKVARLVRMGRALVTAPFTKPALGTQPRVAARRATVKIDRTRSSGAVAPIGETVVAVSTAEKAMVAVYVPGQRTARLPLTPGATVHVGMVQARVDAVTAKDATVIVTTRLAEATGGGTAVTIPSAPVLDYGVSPGSPSPQP